MQRFVPPATAGESPATEEVATLRRDEDRCQPADKNHFQPSTTPTPTTEPAVCVRGIPRKQNFQLRLFRPQSRSGCFPFKRVLPSTSSPAALHLLLPSRGKFPPTQGAAAEEEAEEQRGVPGVEEEEEERKAGERGEGADADGGQRQAEGADRGIREGKGPGEEGIDGHDHAGILLVK